MAHWRPLLLCGRLSVLSSALLCSAVILAQTAAPTARIVSPIDENQLLTLPGNVNPHANVKNDRGAVSPDLPMKDQVLVLGRSPEQQAAFNALVASQYHARSPNYQWLSPALQIDEIYGGFYRPADMTITPLPTLFRRRFVHS